MMAGRSEMQERARAMAADPQNPYKLQFVGEEAGWLDTWAVLNPDGSLQGTYDREGAEWWAAHLYWLKLQEQEQKQRAADWAVGYKAGYDDCLDEALTLNPYLKPTSG